MMLEKTGFKMVNRSGSLMHVGAFSLPFFTRLVNFRHWFLNHLYFTRSWHYLQGSIFPFAPQLPFFSLFLFFKLIGQNSSKTSLSEHFFKASLPSRTANCVFLSANMRARYFSFVSVHTRSFEFFGFSAILNPLFG